MSSPILFTVLVCAIFFSLYAFVVEPNKISIQRVSLASNALHALFRDKKVVHISDLHITSIGYREKRLVSMLNQIHPDILFITGDLLTYGRDEDACIEVLRGIHRPAYGIWAVLGNSDRFRKNGERNDLRNFVRRLEKIGVRVLEDAHARVALNPDGGPLYILGVEGNYLSGSKLVRLVRDMEDDAPIILLSHYPDVLGDNADALIVNLQEAEDAEISGWGWQDNAFFEQDSGIVRFEKEGRHTLRVQRREDGVAIEQICLVPENGGPFPLDPSSANSTRGTHRQINPHGGDMIVIKVSDIADDAMFGSWKEMEDRSSEFSRVIKDIPDDGTKIPIPLKAPANYFEAPFPAKGGRDYHVWLRMRAEDDSASSDSVYVQFDDSVNEDGDPVYRIGENGTRNGFKRLTLILAGHTHGGQVRLPLFGALDIVPNHHIPYDMGLFEHAGTRMYVNRGIGITVLPMRLFSPPEITVFEFTREAV